MDVTVPEHLMIHKGAHQHREEGMCVMELVAYLAGEPHTATPACACPIMTRVAQVLNDGAPNDETRTRVLRPYVGRLAASRADPHIEARRVWALVDLSVRTIAADAMEMADLPIPAATLRALAPIDTIARAKAARAAALVAAGAARVAWASWAAEAAEAAARAAAWAARAAEAAAEAAAGMAKAAEAAEVAEAGEAAARAAAWAWARCGYWWGRRSEAAEAGASAAWAAAKAAGAARAPAREYTGAAWERYTVLMLETLLAL